MDNNSNFWNEHIESLNKLGKGLVYCRQFNSLTFYLFEEGELSDTVIESIDLELVEEIRIFNDDGELLIVNTGTGLKSRFREDSFDENKHKDCENILWGTNSKKSDNYTEIFEQKRGISLSLPIELKCDEKNRVYLKVRNYIDYNEIGQAYYNDARFVTIYNKNKK